MFLNNKHEHQSVPLVRKNHLKSDLASWLPTGVEPKISKHYDLWAE